MSRRIFCCLSLAASLLVANTIFAQGQPGEKMGSETDSRYSYFYKGALVLLDPSRELFALAEREGAIRTAVPGTRPVILPLRETHPLENQGVHLYSLPEQLRSARNEIDFFAELELLAQQVDQIVQPVFEQGSAILIPIDEIIVGFETASTISMARSILEPIWDAYGIMAIRQARMESYVLTINDSANGRVYEVSRALMEMESVSFCEPNHIVLQYDEAGRQPWKVSGIPIGMEGVSAPGETMTDQAPLNEAITERSAPSWTSLVSLDFESSSFPPAGWIQGIYTGYSPSTWGRTNYRSHDGSHSIYCAAGLSPWETVLAPGPAPTEMNALLRSPVMDLSSYEEVYVQGWFYARNDMEPDPGGEPQDFARVCVVNKSTWTALCVELFSPADGDCTVDPTTDNGWRKFMFRVPPAFRVSQAYFEFRYQSDDVIQFEGAYLDDIRIVATVDVDTEPLGTDTYSGRQHEFRNIGQVAGLGNDGNDMEIPEAWTFVAVSPDVVVAVIDVGIDLSHPDLNLVTGFDHNGSTGGWARGSHGTACAGNVGAIGHNAVGVLGTAPNVRIMPIYFGGTTIEYGNAIAVAVDQGADVISNSWGTGHIPSTYIETAIGVALASGVTVVFATGNGPDRSPWTWNVDFPCNLTAYTDLICVGNSSPTDEHVGAASSDGIYIGGSSYVGSGPDICAPGTWSYTTDLQGTAGNNDGSLIDPDDAMSADYFPEFGGTSSSTAKIAGIAALMLSVNPSLTPGDVKEILKKTADDIDAPGIDDKTGAGRVNAYHAVLFSPDGCVEDPVRLEPASVSHSSIQAAYDAASDGSAILCHANEFTELAEDVLLDRNLSLTLAGGYDCSHTVRLTQSTINGSLRIGAGTVIIENILLK